MITIIIRLILSAVLLYFSYFETGIFTTIVLGLLLVNGEITGFIFYLQHKNDVLDGVLDKLRKQHG